MEDKLYKDMAGMVSSFSFSWSKWNNQKHSERKCVFRAKETLTWEFHHEYEERKQDNDPPSPEEIAIDEEKVVR